MEERKKKQLKEKLLELLDVKDEEKLLRSFLQDKEIGDLLYEYPELGLSIHTEKKLRTVTAMINYKGRDAPWKK